MTDTNPTIYQKLATDHLITINQVKAFAKLFDDGASVPFIARYRKEQTGGLDDTVLRSLEKALVFERDLAQYRQTVRELIANQTTLTDELITHINQATSKLELDDIYQPYRPRRRSVSGRAKLAGLLPVAQAILAGADPQIALAGFSCPDTLKDDTGEEFAADFGDYHKQITGIEAIILELWSQDLQLLDTLRAKFVTDAVLCSELTDPQKQTSGEKFKDYFEYREPLATLSTHRLLAMLRGRKQEILTLSIQADDEPYIDAIISHFAIDVHAANGVFLTKCAKKLWLDKWRMQIEHRLLTQKREQAESDAIDVFAQNLKHLLMAAPAGRKVILGVDPGFKNGIKMAIISNTGEVLTTETAYPFEPKNQRQQASQSIAKLISTYQVELVAIGNGTASRETEELINTVIKDNNLSATAVVVSEAGASVYSASEIASLELPSLDVSVRGAVSIARRLQDPLSELVKVEPKAIGVGQYQHDVNQSELEISLDKVTQDCVNAVGVDVNTASAAILAHIAGLNKNVAQQIVNYRRNNGAFINREALKNVPRLGVKTFEQSAGFLRIKDGSEPLDATGVHPESYGLVYELLAQNNKTLGDVLGHPTVVQSLGDTTGFSQLAVVLKELAKPAHDPRGEFKTAKFRDDVNHISDLSIGMVLEGVVTNVTAFGCFVDIGVHQDGLVHISELSDTFVDNPAKVVKPQDIVKVRVIGVDENRARISLSMKSGTANPKTPSQKTTRKTVNKATKKPIQPNSKMGSLGALLQQAGLK